ncbi:hypothetical protein HBI24_202000 [Parastagonospora nodorum]|nr:hypothetical protein HBI24_202000 [Parastagonospora nodorum]
MTGVLIVWAKLPDEAVDWYEQEYLPDMRSQFAQHTLHCEITQTGLEGQKVGVLDAPWPLCAIYEVENAREATAKCYEERNHPPAHLFKNRLADACFDVRTFVELKRWENEEWDNTDVSAIESVTCLEWAVPVDMQEEVFNFYTGTVVPLIMGSPEVLRLRILEVDNAITQRGSTLGTKDKKTVHTFLTIVEMESDEWPWDVVMELAEDKNWEKYFEKQDVKWSISTYLVTRAYTEADKPRSAG